MADPINPVDIARAFITRLYNEKQEKASADLANSIDIFINGVLEGRLPYEFIQNADDACENVEGQLTFRIENSLLIVSHNGSHFNEKQIERICSIGDQKHLEKVKNYNMIGHKGIGIKAAFAETEEMIVYSSPYCFKFKKNYYAWKDATREAAHPWQVIPIWTDANEFAHLNLIPQQVHFILHLKNPDSFRKQLEDLASTPNILLFLNRIKYINILGTSLLATSTPAEDPSQTSKILFRNGQPVSSWHCLSSSIDIPPTIHDNLVKLDHHSCPDKFKKDDYKLKVTFAVLLHDEKPTKVENAFLSCYLPTSVRCNFPFLVNSDFLLDASRKNLIDNFWNAFVLGQVAERHFSWLSKLALIPKWRKHILYILAPSSLTGIDGSLTKEYTSTYKDCTQKVPFLPSQEDPAKLLTLVDCVLDRTGFFRYMQREGYYPRIYSQLVDDQLENIQVLYPLLKDEKTWKYQNILNFTATFYKNYPQLFPSLLNFFRERWKEACASDLSFPDHFRQNFLLPFENSLNKPISSFFLSSKNDKPFPDFLKIPRLLDSLLTSPVIEWLQNQVGIKYLSTKDVICGPLHQFIREAKLNTSNTIEAMRFLYRALNENEITESDLKKFIAPLEILTQQGKMLSLHECYLPAAFQPTFPLEGVIQDKRLFISTQYMTPADDPKLWKKLFLILGAQDHISMIRLPDPTIEDLLTKNVFSLDPYLQYLFKDPNKRPLKNSMYKHGHRLLNFVYVPSMNLLSTKDYAYHFWTEIIGHWTTIHLDCSKSQYGVSNQQPRPLEISYLQFIVEKMPVYSSLGKAFPGSELYAPHLKDLIGEWLPVVEIPPQLNMTEEQAGFFKFKMHISLFDCLKVLNQMRQNKPFMIEKYKQILQQLIKTYSQSTLEEKQRFESQPKYILAEDGSWPPCYPNLTCCLIQGADRRFDRTRVKKVLSSEMMEKLSKIMGFGIDTGKHISVKIYDEEEDKKITSELQKKLPLIALCEALNSHKDPRETLQKLVVPARALKISKASTICSSSDNRDTMIVHLENSKLCYRKDISLKHAKLIEALCNYFNLCEEMEHDLPDILSLKETKSRGIPDFLERKGIKQEKLDELNAFYSPENFHLKISEEEITTSLVTTAVQITDQAPADASNMVSSSPLEISTIPQIAHSPRKESTLLDVGVASQNAERTPQPSVEKDSRSFRDSSFGSQEDEEEFKLIQSKILQSSSSQQPPPNTVNPLEKKGDTTVRFPHQMPVEKDSGSFRDNSFGSQEDEEFGLLVKEVNQALRSPLPLEKTVNLLEKKDDTPVRLPHQMPVEKDSESFRDSFFDSQEDEKAFRLLEKQILQPSSSQQPPPNTVNPLEKKDDTPFILPNSFAERSSDSEETETTEPAKKKAKTGFSTQQITSPSKESSSKGKGSNENGASDKSAGGSKLQTPTKLTKDPTRPQSAPPVSESLVNGMASKQPSSIKAQSTLSKEELDIEELDEEAEFNPAVAAENVDFEQVILNKPHKEQWTKQIQNTVPSSKPKMIAPLSDLIKQAPQSQITKIGRWGERFLVDYLIRRYMNHAAGKTKLFFQKIDKVENGVQVVCLDYKGDQISIKIVWLNAVQDAREDRDIDLYWIRNDQIIKRRFIEAKTSYKDRLHFYLKGNQWYRMLSNLNEYRVYHIANAKTANPVKVTKFKHLLNYFLQGSLPILNIQFAAPIKNKPLLMDDTNVEKVIDLWQKLSSTALFPSSNTTWDAGSIARELWKDETTIISDELVGKINRAHSYLEKRGFELGGINSDGNCFLNAFLESSRFLKESIPTLEMQDNKISYLRSAIATLYKGDSNRAKKIKELGEWIQADGEGDLLAYSLLIPIRVLTVEVQGVSDILTFPDSNKARQNWDTIPVIEKPKEYIFIIDMGGHFLYAKPITTK